MNNKKIILLLVLSIFLIGMMMNPATASHTFKDKGYKYKMSTKEYKKMKRNAKKYAKKMSKELGHTTSGYTSKFVKVKKTKKVYMTKNGKINENYYNQGSKLTKKGWKYVKTVNKGHKTTYQLFKKTAQMNCKVAYYNGHYRVYGVAF